LGGAHCDNARVSADLSGDKLGHSEDLAMNPNDWKEDEGNLLTWTPEPGEITIDPAYDPF